jgi:hypothetical protein
MTRTLLCIAALALAGCATAQPPAPMTDQDYAKFSYAVVTTHRCGTSGMVEPGIAGFGLQTLRNNLERRTYDQAQLAAAFSTAEQRAAPTAQECNSVAMHFAEQKRQVEARAAASRSALQTTTTCNRFGTQVLCNTF